MNSLFIFIAALAYILLSRLSLQIKNPLSKELSLSALNIGACWFLVHFKNGTSIILFLIYLGFVLTQYFFLPRHSQNKSYPYLSFFFPISFLVVVNYILPGVLSYSAASFAFVGISFMTFRLSYLPHEIVSNSIDRPPILRYLAFAFFLPTLQIGPISRYSFFEMSLKNPKPIELAPRALFRIVVGATKYFVISNLFDQLSLNGLYYDGNPHSFLDILVSGIASYMYMYFNFSGFSDIAIGLACLSGFEVQENFDAPFKARSIKEFWNRWHMTLSSYMRDVVFTPLSKLLIIRWGPPAHNHAIAVAVFTVFILVGIWHGLGWNYVLFGVIHATGLVINHYYGIWLKRNLSPPQFRAYNKNLLVRYCAIATTFLYVSLSFVVFFSKYITTESLLRKIGF